VVKYELIFCIATSSTAFIAKYFQIAAASNKPDSASIDYSLPVRPPLFTSRKRMLEKVIMNASTVYFPGSTLLHCPLMFFIVKMHLVKQY
jgi:hypothetical protein